MRPEGSRGRAPKVTFPGMRKLLALLVPALDLAAPARLRAHPSRSSLSRRPTGVQVQVPPQPQLDSQPIALDGAQPAAPEKKVYPGAVGPSSSGGNAAPAPVNAAGTPPPREDRCTAGLGRPGKAQPLCPAG